MTEQEIRTILSRQREYFATGATLSREFRAKQLGKLKTSLQCQELPVSVTLWHRADHESVELSGAIDAGSVDRCYCRREYRSGKTQCLCSGDGSSVKNDFGRMLPGGICGGDHRRQSRESGIVTAAV